MHRILHNYHNGAVFEAAMNLARGVGEMHRGQIGEVIQQSGGKMGALQCDPGDLLCVVPPGN